MSEPSEVNAADAVDEEWTYCGIDWDEDHKKKLHAWRDGAGVVRYYSSKYPGESVGGIYRAKLRRTIEQTKDGPKERVTVFGMPSYIGRRADDAAELQGASYTRTVEHERVLQARRDDGLEFEKAIAPLLFMAKKQRTNNGKAALIARIITRLQAEW